MVLPAYSGPDDTSLAIIGICFYTAYYGSEMWLKELDFFGFGKAKYSSLVITVFITFEVVSVIQSFISNLYSGRNSETFLKRYKFKSFLIHTSYMAVLCAIYLAYT